MGSRFPIPFSHYELNEDGSLRLFLMIRRHRETGHEEVLYDGRVVSNVVTKEWPHYVDNDHDLIVREIKQ